jgi:hypothetical protein
METLARFAEALALPRPTPIRGCVRPRTRWLVVAAPNTDVTEVFTRLGWQAVARRPGTRPQHRRDRALDPDVLIF